MTGYRTGGDRSAAGDAVAIRSVSGGIRDHVSPARSMDSINTANGTLGNRAFLQFVGALQGQQNNPGAYPPLQMMDRPPGQKGPAADTKGKKKKTGKPSQEEIAAMREAKEAARKAGSQKKSEEGAAKKTKPAKPEKGAADPEKTFRAVAAGNFRQLDPVTGDASCEMRAPFMLDAMNILAASGCAPESLMPGFSSMYGPEFNLLPADTGSKKGSLPKSGTMPEHYFSLFYPLSVIRQRADDSLRFLIDDEPEGMTYSSGDVNRWKSAMAQYNVDYMRKLAGVQAAMTGDQAPVMGQVSRMLNESRIELSKGGYRQPILPIFTAEYFLSQNEYLHGRPVVLVLTRLGYDNTGDNIISGRGSICTGPTGRKASPGRNSNWTGQRPAMRRREEG